MTPSFYNWNMRSGDASAYTVLVALVNFKGSEFVKVRQLIARAVGNAPIIRQHRGQPQRAQMFVEQRYICRAATSLSSAMT